MTGLFQFNFWMFFVIGVLGFGLCYLRPKLIWWIVLVVTLVTIGYLIEFSDYQTTRLPASSSWPRVTALAVSIFFALALPLLGSVLGRRAEKTLPANDANGRE